MKQIIQHTGLDSRFYECDGKFYPSVTYILGWLPDSPQIKEWIGNKGWEEAERIKNHAAAVGSYVHNAIELMLKEGAIYTDEDFYRDWKSEKDILKIKRALTGTLNFFEEHEPIVLQAEQTILGEDYAGTIDLVCKFPKSKEPEAVYIVDFKTSKSLQESHKLQVEAYRRAIGADYAACLQIGNTTKTRYTFSITKKDKQDFYWEKFQAVKAVYQLDCPNAQPRIEAFREEFKLPKITN